LPLKIQINCKKPGFGRKNPVEDVVTLGPMAHATLVAIGIRFGMILYNLMVNFWMIGIWEHGNLTNENT
jgi:hypothetical protein